MSTGSASRLVNGRFALPGTVHTCVPLKGLICLMVPSDSVVMGSYTPLSLCCRQAKHWYYVMVSTCCDTRYGTLPVSDVRPFWHGAAPLRPGTERLGG